MPCEPSDWSTCSSRTPGYALAFVWYVRLVASIGSGAQSGLSFAGSLQSQDTIDASPQFLASGRSKMQAYWRSSWFLTVHSLPLIGFEGSPGGLIASPVIGFVPERAKTVSIMCGSAGGVSVAGSPRMMSQV